MPLGLAAASVASTWPMGIGVVLAGTTL